VLQSLFLFFIVSSLSLQSVRAPLRFRAFGGVSSSPFLAHCTAISSALETIFAPQATLLADGHRSSNSARNVNQTFSGWRLQALNFDRESNAPARRLLSAGCLAANFQRHFHSHSFVLRTRQIICNISRPNVCTADRESKRYRWRRLLASHPDRDDCRRSWSAGTAKLMVFWPAI